MSSVVYTYSKNTFNFFNFYVNYTSNFIDQTSSLAVKHAAIGLISGLAVSLYNDVNPVASAVFYSLAGSIHVFVKPTFCSLNQNDFSQAVGRSLFAGIASYAITRTLIGLPLSIPNAFIVGTLAYSATKVYQYAKKYFNSL